MTTTRTELPPLRPFTREECDALVSASIIAEGEQAAVLSGARLFQRGRVSGHGQGPESFKKKIALN